MTGPVGKVQHSAQAPAKTTSSNYVMTKNDEFGIPFLKEATEQKGGSTPTPKAEPKKEYRDVYGLTIERELIGKITVDHTRPTVELKNGTIVQPRKNTTAFQGKKAKIYKDKDDSIVFENMQNAFILDRDDSSDKYKFKNSNRMHISVGRQDTVKVDNLRNSLIENNPFSNQGRGLTKLIDGAADPTKGPSMKNVKIDRTVDNQLLWTEDTEYSSY